MMNWQAVHQSSDISELNRPDAHHQKSGGREQNFQLLESASIGRCCGNCPRGTRMPTHIHISKLPRWYIISGGIWLNIDQGRLSYSSSSSHQMARRAISLSLSCSPQSHIGLANKRDLHTRAYGVARHIMCGAQGGCCARSLSADWENNSCRLTSSSLNNIQILFTLPCAPWNYLCRTAHSENRRRLFPTYIFSLVPS